MLLATLGLTTLLARIDSRSGDVFRVSALNNQTLAPVSRLYPRSVGRLPTSAIIDHAAARPLLRGDIVKLYGYKAPDSNQIRVFRVEIIESVLPKPK